MATATRTQQAAKAPPVQAASAPAKAPSRLRQRRSARQPTAAPANLLRRATDRNPAAPAYSAAMADAVEARVRDLMDRALHRGIHVALRQVARAPLAPSGRKAASPAAQAKDAPVIRNGVRCPDYGTITGQLWLLYGQEGAGVTLTRAKELARGAGLSEVTAAVALYNWRKFHGVPNPSKEH